MSSVRRKARARPSFADSRHPRRVPRKLIKGSNMLFGIRRGVPLTLALATTLGLGLVMARSARADGMLLQHTIPREVDAYNFTTGGPYMAPPVPYGHYAADYGDVLHKRIGCATCGLHGLMGGGGNGHSCFHKGCGAGGCGHGGACGQGGGGCITDGAAGHGLFGHGGHSSTGTIGYDPGIGAGYATTWAPASAQTVPLASGQSTCGQVGCGIAAKHSHLSQMLNKIRCGSCGGSGCGACGGIGATGLCGDPGCSLGAGHGHGKGTGCGLCGGKGCGSCLSGLKGGLHGKLASIAGALNKPKISWFNGAGGPVPLTPGYVPYIVSTRSPRDFFSFPPMNPDAR